MHAKRKEPVQKVCPILRLLDLPKVVPVQGRPGSDGPAPHQVAVRDALLVGLPQNGVEQVASVVGGLGGPAKGFLVILFLIVGDVRDNVFVPPFRGVVHDRRRILPGNRTGVAPQGRGTVAGFRSQRADRCAFGGEATGENQQGEADNRY